MDIAAISTGMSSVSADYQARAGVLKAAMEIPAQGIGMLLDGLQQLEEEMAAMIASVEPSLGQNIDMYA